MKPWSIQFRERFLYFGGHNHYYCHTDADGAGCAVVARCISKGDITHHEIADLSEDVRRDINTNKAQTYSLNVILDMHPDEELAKEIDDYNRQHPSSMFVVIDHHPIKNASGEDYLLQYDWAKIYHTFDIKKQELVYGMNGSHKISATFIFYWLLKESFSIYGRHTFMGPDYTMVRAADTLCYERLAIFANAISRYDTWEWRSNPIALDEIYYTYLLQFYGIGEFVDRMVASIMGYNGNKDTMQILSKEETWYCRQYTISKAAKRPSYYTMIRESYGPISCNHAYINNHNHTGRLKWAILLMDFDTPCSSDYSDIMNRYLKEHPDVGFGIFPKIEKGGSLVVSLRSTEESGVDVGAMCALAGGGGHARAAGCPITPNEFAALIEEYKNPFASYEDYEKSMVDLLADESE